VTYLWEIIKYFMKLGPSGYCIQKIMNTGSGLDIDVDSRHREED